MNKLNKRGTARDVILIGVLVFIIAVGMFVIYFAMTTTVNKLVTAPVINESNATVTAFQGVNNVTSKLDYVVFAVFIGLVLALIITSWFVGGEPIFMFIYFIFVVIAVIVSAILSNVWETLVNKAAFGATLAAFPITNQLLTNFPLYVGIVGFIGVVAMFAKPYLAPG